jgi:hypothetical protein
MMRRFGPAFVSLIVLSMNSQGAFARQIREQRTWDELARIIPGMSLRLILPDATVINGRAVEVRPDELVVDVRRTSNRLLHPKGRTGIPRSDVTVIELFPERGAVTTPDAGAIGAALGGVAVSPLLFYLGETDRIPNWAALAIFTGAAAGGAMIANHIHGRSVDMLITVVP